MDERLGINIKARREALGLTQEQLASLLNYKSRSTIAKIESGENDLTQSKIEKVAQALKTTAACLIGANDGSGNNSDESANNDIIRLARAQKKMPPTEWEKMMKIAELSFEEYFKED